MKRIQTILTSDAVSRDGNKLTTVALVRSLLENWRTGVPTMVSHDIHRPLGWMVPCSIHIEPDLRRLLGVAHLPESDEEVEAISKMHSGGFQRRIDEIDESSLDTLRELLSDFLSGEERPVPVEGSALVGDGLAEAVAPEVFDECDEDGLVPLSMLDEIQPGIYRHNDVALFAHPSFRRSLSRFNSLNTEILSELQEAVTDENVVVKIRLDPDTVGLADEVRQSIEWEYWYGPKFDDDLSSIPPGVTRHEATERERAFYGISSTEFWWKSRQTNSGDSEHILEAEELRDLRTFGEEDIRFGCRYVHSIVEEDTNKIHHLDGAVRSYAEEEMVRRLDQKIDETGRAADYRKLWLIEGEVELERWKTLITHHFRNNPLVPEYLGELADEDTTETRRVNPASTNTDEPLPPYSMECGDGVRLAVSLKQREDTLDEAPVVETLRAVGLSDGLTPVFEDDLIEVEKRLQNRGGALDISADAERVSFEDYYYEFPLILHTSEEDLEGNVSAFNDLFEAWAAEEVTRVASVSMGFVTDELVEIRTSVIGESADLLDWLERDIPFPTGAGEGLVEWVEKASSQLDEYPTADNQPQLRSVLSESFTFALDRIRLEPDVVNLLGRDPLRVSLDCSEIRDEVVRALREGRLDLVRNFIIRNSRCSRCKADYRRCGCSKYENGVNQIIEDCDLMGFVATDMSASSLDLE